LQFAGSFAAVPTTTSFWTTFTDTPILAHHVRDDHVTEDERKLRPRQLPVDDVQVGSTNGAGTHTEQKLAVTRRGLRDLCRAQRHPRPIEEHGAHTRTVDFRRYDDCLRDENRAYW
jgi:hypothetical protein